MALKKKPTSKNAQQFINNTTTAKIEGIASEKEPDKSISFVCPVGFFTALKLEAVNSGGKQADLFTQVLEKYLIDELALSGALSLLPDNLDDLLSKPVSVRIPIRVYKAIKLKAVKLGVKQKLIYK